MYLGEDTRTRHETDGAQVERSKGAKHSARGVREYLKRLQSKSCSQPVCHLCEVRGRARGQTSPRWGVCEPPLPRAGLSCGTGRACQGTGGPGQCKLPCLPRGRALTLLVGRRRRKRAYGARLFLPMGETHTGIKVSVWVYECLSKEEASWQGGEFAM